MVIGNTSEIELCLNNDDKYFFRLDYVINLWLQTILLLLMTASVVQRLSLWALDLEVSGLTPDKTNLEMNFLIGPSLGVLGGTPELISMLWYS